MREYLDAILSFIGSASLSEEEWEAVTLPGSPTDLQVYNALLGVLNARDMVSTQQDRLFFYFKAKGAQVPEPVLNKSNIFVGAVLED